MRPVVATVGSAIIYRDKSPDGLPRWVVEHDMGTTVYNKIFYSLEIVKGIYEDSQ